MIKSVTQVFLTVALSFGVMAAGVNPSVRTEVQAASAHAVTATASMLSSVSTSLSTAFSGNATSQGSVVGSFAAFTNVGVQHIASNIQSATSATTKTNSSLSVGSGKTSVATNVDVGLTGSANAGSVSLNTLLDNQLDATLGISK